MKFSNYKKWSLFFVLAGTLGFNLSMNPEHFNNIARYEHLSIQSMDWAQEAAPSDKTAGKTKVYSVIGSKGAFNAKVFSVEGSTFVRFENLSKESEGKACDLCDKGAIPLSANVEDIDTLKGALLALVDGKDKKTISKKSDEGADSSDEEKPVVVQKKGEATEVDLEEWAAKCDKVSDRSDSSAELTCHKGRLIELSKYLKNSKEYSHLVLQYFNEHLKASLMKGFISPTVKSSLFSNGGIMQPNLEVDSSGLEQSNELAEEIISGLRTANGKQTVELLIKMRGASFTAQLRHSQRLMAEGLAQGNNYKLQIGFQGMQPDYQRAILQQATQSMQDSISNMSGSDIQKSALSDYVNVGMYAPYDSILTNLKNFVLNGNSLDPNAKHNFTDFQIPLSFGESVSVLNLNNIAGTEQLSEMIRRGYNTRGADISDARLWGTGDGAISNNSRVSMPGTAGNVPPAERGRNNHPTSF